MQLLGIKPGSMVDFQRAPDGRVVLVKPGKGLSTDAILPMTRGEV